VDATTFDALKRMNRELGFEQARARNRNHFYSEAEAGVDREEELELFGERVVRGKAFGQTAAGSKPDIEDNLRWIREARRQADWVIASFHSHEFAHKSVLNAKSRGELTDPPDFAPAYAHAAIDAGADVFVGHGSHTALGIEIYKGKPIFYSVGTLIMQNETLPFFPSEAYQRFGLDNDAAPGDFIDTRTGNGTKGHVAQAEFWENITTTCHFDSGKLTEVRVYPLDQGFGRTRAQRGRPVLAQGALAAKIIDRVNKLSQPLGVTVKNRDGIGIITP
jgi:poly-gamma-glutamate synthesis protein (capsule biosynthesis protein)